MFSVMLSFCTVSPVVRRFPTNPMFVDVFPVSLAFCRIMLFEITCVPFETLATRPDRLKAVELIEIFTVLFESVKADVFRFPKKPWQ